MKGINTLSVKASWTLVLVAFSGLVVVIGGLGLFANHFGRDAFTSLHQRDMTQISQLNSAYNQLLRARIQMNRAAELIRTPSFDRPDPLIEEAEQLLASAEQNFARFEASHFDSGQQAVVDQLASDFQSFVNNNLSLQMMMLEERDITGFFSGESRVDESSQRFIDSADAFFEASAQRGNALFARFEQVSALLFWGVIAGLAASLLVVAMVVWGASSRASPVEDDHRTLPAHCSRRPLSSGQDPRQQRDWSAVQRVGQHAAITADDGESTDRE